MVVAVAATYLYVVRSGIFCQLFIHGALLESSIMKAETLNMRAQYPPPLSIPLSLITSASTGLEEISRTFLSATIGGIYIG